MREGRHEDLRGPFYDIMVSKVFLEEEEILDVARDMVIVRWKSSLFHQIILVNKRSNG